MARAVRAWLARAPRFWPCFWLALVVSALIFTRNPASNYIFDEQEAILANPYLRAPNVGWLEVIHRDFWGLPPERTIGSYRPVPNLLWRLASAPARLWPRFDNVLPWWLHMVNVVIHAACGAALAAFAFAATRSRAVGWLTGAAMVCCAVLTEAVTGVVGLADVSAGLAVVVSLHALRLPWWGLPWAVYASLTLAFFCKESTIAVLPGIVLAALMLTPALHPGKRIAPRGALTMAASLGALVTYVELRKRWFPVQLPSELSAALPADAAAPQRAVRAFMVWFHQPRLPRDPMNNPLLEADFVHRCAGALRVYAEGVLQLVFPWQLSGDYSFPQEPAPRAWEASSLLGLALWLAPVALGVGLWGWQRTLRARGDAARAARWAWVGWGLLWMASSYFPHSNIPALLPTVRAERLWYLPALGAAAALGVLGARALDGQRRWEKALVVGYLLFQGLQARGHAVHYTDDLVFWRATRVAVPHSAKARLNFAVMVGARGDLEGRLSAGAEALRLAPEWPMAHVYQGDTLCRMNRVDEAWPHYERGFLLDPNSQSLLALGLQCLWERGAIAPRSARLLEMAEAHPGTWLAYLAADIVHHGEEHAGVDPRYRPRGYNQGPKE